jgi:hypothetical protein
MNLPKPPQFRRYACPSASRFELGTLTGIDLAHILEPGTGYPCLAEV